MATNPTKAQAQAGLDVAGQFVAAQSAAPPPPPPPPVSYPAWVENAQYAAGAIVKFTDGKLYRAKVANPGYSPVVSTYYWEPYAAVNPPAPPPTPPPAGTLDPAAIAIGSHDNMFLQVGNPADAYYVEDNRWGLGAITEGAAANQYEQAVGVSPAVGAGGEVAYRMKWRWPAGPNEVKAYPAIISGQRPGYAWGQPVMQTNGAMTARSGVTPGTFFPLQLPVKSLKTKFAVKNVTAPTGMGHLSYDIWLQSTPAQDSPKANSSITHEIMIPLQNWGNYGGANNLPNGRNSGWYDHDVTLGGRLYHVYATKGGDGAFLYNFAPGSLNGRYGRTGWKMIAFVPDVFPVPAGELDLAAFINHVATRTDAKGNPWALGNEYVSSVELGVEPVQGTGDIAVYDYRVFR
jgi:hypothetical protein